jgi:predicted Zn-dependent protease
MILKSLFYNLGRKVGPRFRKAKWVWKSMTGSEADAIKVENDVGRDLAHEIRQNLRPDPDAGTGQMLGKIGRRLGGCAANRFRTFSFESVQQAEPNAFALPGGFIFVTRSLLELCERNTDEIAFILGHEMAHVIRGHAMQRIISNSAISTASSATPLRGLLGGWLRKVGVQFLETAYSRELESEADRLAVRLVSAARFDPQAAIKLLSRLKQLKTPKGEFDLGIYFSTHPAFEERIRNIRAMLRKLSR